MKNRPSLRALTAGLALSALAALPASAEEHIRQNATITSIHPVTGNRPAGRAMQNYTRVYINADGWSPSAPTCRTSAFDLDNSEMASLSVILLAFSKQKPITVYVDDNLRTAPNEDVCIATALLINP